MFNSISATQTYPIGEAPIENTSKDTFTWYAKNLPWRDVATISRISKKLRKLVQPILNTEWMKIREEVTFGKVKWLSIPGVTNVGNEPPLPADIDERLKARCKGAFPGRFFQHGMLILIPETINDQPHTAENIGKVMHFLNHGDKERCPGSFTPHTMKDLERCRSEEMGEGYSNTVYKTFDQKRYLYKREAPQSHWIWISNNIVPNSHQHTYEAIEEFLKSKNWRPPSLIEGITSILIMNHSFQKREEYFFGWMENYKSYFFTYVSDKCWNDEHVRVGAMSSEGLSVWFQRRRDDYRIAGSAAVEDVQ